MKKGDLNIALFFFNHQLLNLSAESHCVDHRIASDLTRRNHQLDQPEQNGSSVPNPAGPPSKGLKPGN
jgi:hypothetical protein